MEVDPTLAKHTVYRPNDISAVGSAKLPIMAWGNGACAADGNAFRLFLTEIASHGYLVIANGPIGPDRAQFPPTMPPNRGAGPAGARGQGAPEGRAPQPGAAAKPGVPPGITSTPPTTTAQLIEAIDWAIAENSRQGSRYYGKLDTSKNRGGRHVLRRRTGDRGLGRSARKDHDRRQQRIDDGSDDNVGQRQACTQGVSESDARTRALSEWG